MAGPFPRAPDDESRRASGRFKIGVCTRSLEHDVRVGLCHPGGLPDFVEDQVLHPARPRLPARRRYRAGPANVGGPHTLVRHSALTTSVDLPGAAVMNT